MIELAVVFNEHKLSGILTRIFTGCYAYHCLWVDRESKLMWDMHLLRRRREWPHYPEATVQYFSIPGVSVTKEYLEKKLQTDESKYGVIDYMMFALRPLFHMLGKSTRNAKGIICSEMVNNDIWECGGSTPWAPTGVPPSPCDIYKWAKQPILK